MGSLWESAYGASIGNVMDDVTAMASYSWRHSLQVVDFGK